MGFIYILTAPNGKSYVGQTKRSVDVRIKQHWRVGKCTAIHHALRKYGMDAFDVDWFQVPDDQLNTYEAMVVERLDTMAPRGYNLVGGGGAGKEVSKETRERMRVSHVGKTLAEETRRKIKETLTGTKQSQETCAKRRESLLGRKITSEDVMAALRDNATKRAAAQALGVSKPTLYKLIRLL